MPFLRRYQPALAFPLFFLFQLLVWSALTGKGKRSTRISAIFAGGTLVILVFAYLYFWTAAAAWLVCIGGLWFLFRPSDRRKTLTVLITIGVTTAIALVPYIYLLSHRAATVDERLNSTHRPDLLRIHEILGAAIILALVIGVLRCRIVRTEPGVIYVASLALLPFIVFNQQVLTGVTMQAFHFEMFVVNYSTLLGLVVVISLFWNSVPRRLLNGMAGLSFAWGLLVVGLPARLIFVPQAITNDKAIPVLLRLKELSNQDGTLADLHTQGQTSTRVFSPSVPLIALLPTWTSQATLLDMMGLDCLGLAPEERKRLFFMHLFYSKTDTEALRQALNGTPERFRVELSGVRSAIFGYERIFPALSPEFRPVQQDEIEDEVQAYQAYVNFFSREEALKSPLTYAVIPVESNFNPTNLDRWYERDAGERVGDYTLYRLKLRD
jgi:hypothetical protein